MRAWITAALLMTATFSPSVPRAETAEELAVTCAACHGEDGLPNAPEVPVISGQQQGYLYLQLRDLKSGARQSEVMSPIAADLSKDEMKALAAFFAARPWPRLDQSATPAQTEIAQRTNIAGTCTACHMEGYLGVSTAPRLAGQQQAYLELTMSQFKTKQRGNNPGMSGILESFPDPDLAAMAAYLGSL